ncbi:hypothetical protein [Nitrosomonas oligotropha]|uniref:Uncharacterized protein n=1 Tax=Nitrosomonas oligotropha TaxID=42354 RepID=A0A1H8S0X8_9PROT|nr:hypothetical protein [Nitrosomonas oligotropha]SDX00250.1 hypothetical protein SAMN05216300_11537 [Nitrosomonas oligotropha]SEO72196.1 hypothetical protein SAMN05216333_11637 [Nitrosomonas oligotropha]
MKTKMLKISTLLGATAIFFATSLAAADANAAGIRIKCEKKSNRSSISVDGRNLTPGSYSAVVKSGDNKAVAELKSSTGDEVEFDFDSDKGDIVAGAVAISPIFIQGGKVTGQIKDADGFIIIEGTSSCRVR